MVKSPPPPQIELDGQNIKEEKRLTKCQQEIFARWRIARRLGHRRSRVDGSRRFEGDALFGSADSSKSGLVSNLVRLATFLVIPTTG